MLDETDRCPRCGKYAPADPHTCSPAPIVPILEARVAELEARLSLTESVEDSILPNTSAAAGWFTPCA